MFDDLDFAFREYEPFAAYGQSKTANVLFAVEADPAVGWRRDHRERADARRDLTNLQRHVGGGGYIERAKRFAAQAAVKTPEQGAATSVLLAASPLLDGVGGRYFEDCHEAPGARARGDDLGWRGALRPRPGERRAAVGGLTRPHRPAVTRHRLRRGAGAAGRSL